MKENSQTPNKRKFIGVDVNSAKRPYNPYVEDNNAIYDDTADVKTLSDTDMEDASEQTATADNLVLNNTIMQQYFLTPGEMSRVLESFFVFVKESGLLKKSFKNNKKIIKDFVEKSPHTPYTAEQITQAYKYYIHEATKKMDFEGDNIVLKNYLDSDSVVTMYPDFPKNPPTVFAQYKKMKNLPLDPSKNTEHKKLMEEDLVGHREAELSVLEQQVFLFSSFYIDLFSNEFLQKLRDFVETHQDNINNEQKKFVEKKINFWHKKLHPPDTPRTPRKKGQVVKEVEDEEEQGPIRVPQSPFDLYVQLKSSDPEFEGKSQKKIEKKLKKKFETITPEEMNLLEMMFKLENKRKPL